LAGVVVDDGRFTGGTVVGGIDAVVGDDMRVRSNTLAIFVNGPDRFSAVSFS
jgi:pyrimidine operon attenuation protein/uracil phosphoribosyltransferase